MSKNKHHHMLVNTQIATTTPCCSVIQEIEQGFKMFAKHTMSHGNLYT